MKRPTRGEVWIVDLGFAAKIRPGVIVSVPLTDTDRVLATLVPHTTARRGTRFEAPIAKRFLKEGAFDAQNLVTVPCGKLVQRIGALTDVELKLVIDKVSEWLGLAQ